MPLLVLLQQKSFDFVLDRLQLTCDAVVQALPSEMARPGAINVSKVRSQNRFQTSREVLWHGAIEDPAVRDVVCDRIPSESLPKIFGDSNPNKVLRAPSDND